MRFAIFSDLHDNYAALLRVLADAEQQRAEQLIFLGDAGRDPHLLSELQQRGVACTFGNWEVSGLRHLAAPLADWVGAWSATILRGEAIFCHATPDMPAVVTNTVTAGQMMANGISWSTLFPRLNRNEQARWNALAALETTNLRVAFHGHTHIQMVWAWQADQAGQRQLRSFTEPTEFDLEAGPGEMPTRYLIGVGSAGQPDDGPQLRYALYDDQTQCVMLRRLAAK
ncbi:MAG: metallophosphoesterase family protein [Caldilineaceae bacterium]